MHNMHAASTNLFLLACSVFIFSTSNFLAFALRQSNPISRREALAQAAATAAIVAPFCAAYPSQAQAAISNGIQLTDTPSGMRWADVKIGTGQPLKKGNRASIDYSMASTAGRSAQIYSTKDTGSPYRWTLGDGSTIQGIEMAILGDTSQGIPPMVPGSIRRVIIPQKLGFQSLMTPNSICIAGEPGSLGPIPPKENIAGTGSYHRWFQLYCNPRIPYQPDLVVDIKLYGKR